MVRQQRAGVLDRAHRLTTAGLLMLVTFIAFEAMAVGTAMPTAVAELHGLAWYAWPFSAFLVASVVGMVAGAAAGRRRTAGRTRASPIPISGSRARKTTRQLACVVSTPATSGPTSPGITQAALIAPNSRGRRSGS